MPLRHLSQPKHTVLIQGPDGVTYHYRIDQTATGLKGDMGAPGAAGQPINFRGTWTNMFAYSPLDVVLYIASTADTKALPESGDSYLCVLANASCDPSQDDGTHWRPVIPHGQDGPDGARGDDVATGDDSFQKPWAGAWEASGDYTVGTVCKTPLTDSDGMYWSYYICTEAYTADDSSFTPDHDATHWDLYMPGGLPGATVTKTIHKTLPPTGTPITGDKGPVGDTGPTVNGVTGATGPAGPATISDPLFGFYNAGTVYWQCSAAATLTGVIAATTTSLTAGAGAWTADGLSYTVELNGTGIDTVGTLSQALAEGDVITIIYDPVMLGTPPLVSLIELKLTWS